MVLCCAVSSILVELGHDVLDTARPDGSTPGRGRYLGSRCLHFFDENVFQVRHGPLHFRLQLCLQLIWVILDVHFLHGRRERRLDGLVQHFVRDLFLVTAERGHWRLCLSWPSRSRRRQLVIQLLHDLHLRALVTVYLYPLSAGRGKRQTNGTVQVLFCRS